MKNIIISYLKQFCFLILLFAFTRLIFILYFYKKLENIKIVEILQTFWYSLRLDISTISYILIFPFFLLLIQALSSAKLMQILHKIYYSLIIFVIFIITISELGVYEEWNTKLNYKAITHLRNPKEIFDILPTQTFIFFVISIIVLSLFFFFIYNCLFYIKIQKLHKIKHYIFLLIFFVIVPIFLLGGIRGGMQQVPINQSFAYFSKYNFLNDASVNSVWNVFFSITTNTNRIDKNMYNFYSLEEAEKEVENIYKIAKDSTIKILTTDKPNIVLFVLESWSADVVESLGGLKGISPNFEKLIKTGVLFDSIYASGSLSDQGIVALLSGFPAQPVTSIINHPDKMKKLPSLNQKLSDMGYKTSFYYGGQLSYGNIKAFLYHNKFDKITEIYDFPTSVRKGKMGVHDEFVLNRISKELKKEHQPFFSVFFTSSTHSPYDIPQTINKINYGNDNINKFFNSVYYSDSCLYDFMEKAKKEDWYDNTLFIFIADHSRYTSREWNVFSDNARKIPLLFYGKPIKNKYKGLIIRKIGSQIDLANTILNQMNISANEFEWSKNLLNPYTKEFAYYAFDIGVGWVSKGNNFAYDINMKQFMVNDFENQKQKDSLTKIGKSYLQLVFEKFYKY